MRKISHWLEEYTPSESIDLIKDIALSHSRKGGIQGAYISSLIVAEDWMALCDYEVNYEWSGWTIHHLVECRQALALFSKLEFLDLGIDKERVAFDKFREAESLCESTNDVFEKWARGEFQFYPRVDAVLFTAQRKIAQVLGTVPALEKLRYRFGPGATTLTKKRDANALSKLSAGIACSEDLALGAHQLLNEMPAWADLHGIKIPEPSEAISSEFDFEADMFPGLPRECILDYVEPYSYSVDTAHVDQMCGQPVTALSTSPADASVPVQIMDGALGFVAKNAKTYRGIVTEPPLNGVYQLALGDYMAKRLARFGVDLRDQSLNQRLAKEGSLTGALATLDLSSASDTIATEVVYHLLPVDWALALSAGRSSSVVYKGGRLHLEKFSSMGNGYTFALESLIFWALASSCSANGFASVYGDDIIVPTTAVPLLKETLDACGFVLNTRKSYSQGPFRESCGADYFRGFDIRPFYQKDLVTPAALMKLHNFYVRHNDVDRAAGIKKMLHPVFHIEGPDRFGDGHLVSDSFSRRRKARHDRLGYSGYVFDTFKAVGKRMVRKDHLPGDYVFSLYTIYSRSNEPLLGSEQNDLGKHLGVVAWAKTLKARRFLVSGSVVGDAIPESTTLDGGVVKEPSVPGTADYKRISIYTLG